MSIRCDSLPPVDWTTGSLSGLRQSPSEADTVKVYVVPQCSPCSRQPSSVPGSQVSSAADTPTLYTRLHTRPSNTHDVSLDEHVKRLPTSSTAAAR
ncbi:hypothetical protein EYF80_060621 [Liparis tanakae]|uniref:Uncharacterized protein n=1 Tax=Liparis tanakae TaxID=230148 RepID=A0A4Z2ELJ8_9TELE|nr:hypothetical protein EYF80_060621 [Liparis tanakae]